MTPCQQLGFREGDIFLYTGRRYDLVGLTFKLIRDDGSECPIFTAVGIPPAPYHKHYRFVFSFDEIREEGVMFNE